jgi:hypothetical protein
MKLHNEVLKAKLMYYSGFESLVAGKTGKFFLRFGWRCCHQIIDSVIELITLFKTSVIVSDTTEKAK